MEIFLFPALILAILITVSGFMHAIERKEFDDIIYIKYWCPEKHRINNRLLVIGFLRCFFKFKFFFYINLKTKEERLFDHKK